MTAKYTNCTYFHFVHASASTCTLLYVRTCMSSSSQHDTTVVAMATALGVYNGIMPPYATALIIELYSDTTG